MSNRNHYVVIIARDLKAGDTLYSEHRLCPVLVTKVVTQEGQRVYFEYTTTVDRPGLLDCGKGSINATCDTKQLYDLVMVML